MITIAFTAEEIVVKYAFYLQNGTKVDALPDGYEKFYVAEDLERSSEYSRYYYPGDDIQYLLDALCVNLYDAFQDAIFPSRDEFYAYYDIQPQWISRAGLDSDFDMSKDDAARCFATSIPARMAELGVKDDKLLEAYQEIEARKFRYAYTADCQSLVNTLQELIMGCHSSFVGFYKHLCSLHSIPEMEGVYYEVSAESRMVFSFLYSFIIQSYSMFDILTKIAYEFEHLKKCESTYAKLAASNILYGARTGLRIDPVGTVFEKCRTTSIIENLRNELVHNATWEMNSKIYIMTEAGQIIERHILMPDFTAENTLMTFKSRKRFFAQGKKVNNELPELYFDVMRRVHTTLEKLMDR